MEKPANYFKILYRLKNIGLRRQLQAQLQAIPNLPSHVDLIEISLGLFPDSVRNKLYARNVASVLRQLYRLDRTSIVQAISAVSPATAEYFDSFTSEQDYEEDETPRIRSPTPRAGKTPRGGSKTPNAAAASSASKVPKMTETPPSARNDPFYLLFDRMGTGTRYLGAGLQFIDPEAGAALLSAPAREFPGSLEVCCLEVRTGPEGSGLFVGFPSVSAGFEGVYSPKNPTGSTSAEGVPVGAENGFTGLNEGVVNIADDTQTSTDLQNTTNNAENTSSVALSAFTPTTAVDTGENTYSTTNTNNVNKTNGTNALACDGSIPDIQENTIVMIPDGVLTTISALYQAAYFLYTQSNDLNYLINFVDRVFRVRINGFPLLFDANYSKLSQFIAFSASPNCDFVLIKQLGRPLLGLRATRQIFAGEQLSVATDLRWVRAGSALDGLSGSLRSEVSLNAVNPLNSALGGLGNLQHLQNQPSPPHQLQNYRAQYLRQDLHCEDALIQIQVQSVSPSKYYQFNLSAENSSLRALFAALCEAIGTKWEYVKDLPLEAVPAFMQLLEMRNMYSGRLEEQSQLRICDILGFW